MQQLVERDRSCIDSGGFQSSKRRDPELGSINACNCQKWMLAFFCDALSLSPRFGREGLLIAYRRDVEWCLCMVRGQENGEGRSTATIGQRYELFVGREHVCCGLIE